MTHKFAKRTASVFAIGLALTLAAGPSLAQERRDPDRGNRDHPRGSYNNHAGLARPSDTRPARQPEQAQPAQQAAPARPDQPRWRPDRSPDAVNNNDGQEDRPRPNRPGTNSPWSNSGWNGNGGPRRPYNGQPNNGQPNTPDPDNNAGRPGNNWGHGRPDQGRPDNGNPGNNRPQNGWHGHGGGDNGWSNGDRDHDHGRPDRGGPDRGWSNHGWQGHGGWNGGGQPPHFDWRHDHRFSGYNGVRFGFYFFPGTGYYRVPSQWYGHRWYAGEYLPDFFYSYRIYDWDYYGLPQPPFGCAWFIIGEDAVLVDLDSGSIIDVDYDIY